MYWRTHHKLLFRITALALFAFCILSNGRGLVPGMCATLAAAQDGAAQSGCCKSSYPPRAEKHQFPLTLASSGIEHPACAFCHLTKGFIQVQAYVYCERPEPAAKFAAVMPAELPHSADPRHAARPRDPPSCSVIS